jgi:hypothetical protein
VFALEDHPVRTPAGAALRFFLLRSGINDPVALKQCKADHFSSLILQQHRRRAALGQLMFICDEQSITKIID